MDNHFKLVGQLLAALGDIAAARRMAEQATAELQRIDPQYVAPVATLPALPVDAFGDVVGDAAQIAELQRLRSIVAMANGDYDKARAELEKSKGETLRQRDLGAIAAGEAAAAKANEQATLAAMVKLGAELEAKGKRIADLEATAQRFRDAGMPASDAVVNRQIVAIVRDPVATAIAAIPDPGPIASVPRFVSVKNADGSVTLTANPAFVSPSTASVAPAPVVAQVAPVSASVAPSMAAWLAKRAS